MSLSLSECVEMKDDLSKAMTGKEPDVGRLKDILSTLKATDVKGKLKVCPNTLSFA